MKPRHACFLLFSLSLLLVSLSIASTDSSIRHRYNHILKHSSDQPDSATINQLQQLIESDWTFHDAYVELYYRYQQHHQPDTAIHYFSHLLESNPNNPYARFALGLVLKKQGAHDRAADLFKHAIQLSPSYSSPYKSLMMLYCDNNAMADAQASLDEIRSKYGETAALHYGQGYLYIRQNKWEAAEQRLTRAFELDSTILDIFILKGVICFYTSNFDRLYDVSQQGYKRAQRMENMAYQSRFLGNMGMARSHAGKLHEGIAFEEQALMLARQIGEETEITRNINNLGVDYRNLGNYLKALQYFQEALAGAQALNDRVREGLALRNIGSAYRAMGDFHKALDYFNQALPVVEETQDINTKGLLFWSLGLLNWDFGNYYQSLDNYIKALEIAREMGNRWAEGRYYTSIGLIYWNLGNYTKALNYYEQALAIADEIQDVDGRARVLGNIALIYNKVGDDVKAIEYELQSLAVFQQVDLKDEISRTLGNIGISYQVIGQFDQAADYYLKAIELNREIGNKSEQAYLLGNLGTLYQEQKSYDLAIKQYNDALKISSDIGFSDAIMNQYINLGNIYLELNQYNQAFLNFRQANQIATKSYASGQIVEAEVGLANTEVKRGNRQSALAHYQQAIIQLEKVRNSLMEDEFKTSFIRNNYAIYEQIIELLADLHQTDPAKQYHEQGFEYAERAKSRALLDVINQGRAIHNPEIIPPELNDQYLITEKSIELKYAALSEISNQTSDVKQQQQRLQTDLDGLIRSRSILLDKMRDISPEYYALTHPQILTAHEIQQHALSPGQMILEYAVTDNHIFCWLISRQNIQFSIIHLNRVELRAAMEQVSPIFRRTEFEQTGVFDHRWANINPDALHNLYIYLIEQPMGKMGDSCQELIIVPDDILFYIPFEMLVTNFENRQPHFLIEEVPLSYLPAAGMLLSTPKLHAQPTDDLLAFGNPNFEVEKENSLLKWLLTFTAMNPTFRGNQFTALPESEREVQQIAQNFKHASLFIGDDATEEQFKQMAGNFRFIHLATHNITNDHEPMYSKIVLAQSADGKDDGFLQTYEIYNLHLNAELVVLSGCNTGLGKLSRGEGLIGMTRAFFYAGAPSLIVSLWSVHDASTAELMKQFYENIATGMSKTNALQHAKIALIHSNDIRQNPFYWAPFILIGDGGSIQR
ncbi:CHAT domain-containing protein [candidate division KSB1 bacterium]|nr:CHAT domain-containing protein [candidate division KSB1 bacterium]